MECKEEIGGSEGSGIIEDVGSELGDKGLKGRKVAFCHGAWAQWVVKDVDCLLYFSADADLRLAATAVTTPLAALCLKYLLLDLKAHTFLVSGAASTLGRMLLKVALRKNLRPIALVYSEKEASALAKEFGQVPVVLAADKERLAKVIAEERPMHLVALAGSEAGVFEAMPPGAEMVVAGNMANASLSLATTELYMHAKRIQGFNFERHIASMDKERRRELMRIVEEDINAGGEYFGIRGCKEFEFEEWDQAVKEKGRVLLRFHKDS